MSMYHVLFFVPLRLPEEARAAVEAEINDYLTKIEYPPRANPNDLAGRFISTEQTVQELTENLREVAPDCAFCIVDRHDAENFQCYPEYFRQEISEVPKDSMQHAMLRIQDVLDRYK